MHCSNKMTAITKQFHCLRQSLLPLSLLIKKAVIQLEAHVCLFFLSIGSSQQHWPGSKIGRHSHHFFRGQFKNIICWKVSQAGQALIAASLPNKFTCEQLQRIVFELFSHYSALEYVKANLDRKGRPYCFIKFSVPPLPPNCPVGGATG